MVIDTGVVVPALIRFLTRIDTPALQIEAAWSLTNIACGEARHIHCLLELGAMQELMQVIATTKNVALKDQALWAVCNMTATIEACEYVLLIARFLEVILLQVGLQCEFVLEKGAPDGSQSALKRIFQCEMNDLPTLSSMRHVTFICGNIAR